MSKVHCGMFSWLLGAGYVALLLAAPAFAADQAMRVGVWTQIWPWMWEQGRAKEHSSRLSQADKMRWLFAEANLGEYSNLNARWNLLVLRQGRDGADGWARARAIVDYQARLDIATVFRLIEDPDIYLAMRKGGVEKQKALADYEKWVESLARNFAGKVQYFLVSNEIDHNFGTNLLQRRDLWVDYDEYRLLLEAASQAIRREAPGTKVVDHGLSAYSLALAVAYDVYQRKGLDSAYAFWRACFFDNSEQHGSLGRLSRTFGKDDTQRRIAIAERTFRTNDLQDFHQLHWYFNPDVLPEVLDWIARQQQASVRVLPLFVSELGYRMPVKDGKAWDERHVNVADYSRYSEQAHAAALVKGMMLLVAAGVRHIQYWQVRVHHARDTSAQLYAPAKSVGYFKPSLAHGSFRLLAGWLNEGVAAASCDVVGDITTCTVRNAKREFRVIWKQAGSVQVSVPSSVTAIYEYTGKLLDPAERVSAGSEPVILETRTSGG